jgi:hypothetical protein
MRGEGKKGQTGRKEPRSKDKRGPVRLKGKKRQREMER